MRATLLPHPSTADGPINAVEVQLERDGAVLWLRYVVEGEVDEVAWPAPEPQARADELWRHTCMEVFVRTDDGYREYNLSPSGRWASYAFSAPRSGMRDADEVATVLGLDGAKDLVGLEARVELPVGFTGQVGLSAVIKDRRGHISYWALAHPSDKPDFHHPASFVLELP